MTFIKVNRDEEPDRTADPACVVVDQGDKLFRNDTLVAAYVNYKAARLISVQLNQLNETLERNLGQLSGLNISDPAGDTEGGG